MSRPTLLLDWTSPVSSVWWRKHQLMCERLPLKFNSRSRNPHCRSLCRSIHHFSVNISTTLQTFCCYFLINNINFEVRSLCLWTPVIFFVNNLRSCPQPRLEDIHPDFQFCFCLCSEGRCLPLWILTAFVSDSNPHLRHFLLLSSFSHLTSDRHSVDMQQFLDWNDAEERNTLLSKHLYENICG